MTFQTKAFTAVADLARAFETASIDAQVSKAQVDRLQRQAERLAVDATEAEYQARTYRRQGVKTRAKLKALRHERAVLRDSQMLLMRERDDAEAQVKRLRQENLRLRQDRDGLVKDLYRLHPGHDASRFFDVRSRFDARVNCIELRAGVSHDFRISVLDLSHIRSEAGIEALAAAHARKTAEGLRPVFVQAIKAAAGIR